MESIDKEHRSKLSIEIKYRRNDYDYKEEAFPWKQTYQAYGRTIEVDCTVNIPLVHSFPVLTVQPMPPVSEPLYSALMQRYAKPKGTKLDYEFRSNDYQTVITRADPKIGRAHV